MKTFYELLLDIQQSAELLPARTAFLKAARAAAALPIIRRPHSYAEIGTHRSWLDGRAKVLEPETQETFAFAMADHNMNYTLSSELPLLAAAYVLSGEESFKQRVWDQLEELTHCSPLQRPGWTCYAAGKRLPDDGKDGSWLATGTGIRAIADTLEVLPGDLIPEHLRNRLHTLLEAEIVQIMDDWACQRQWFVRANNALTNQWVLPIEGLIRACLVLGVDTHREAYDFGVTNMLASFNAHGDDGEFEEGAQYAALTITSFLASARAMARAGDLRLMEHPFLQRFPLWHAHHLMPGRLLINAFDCFNGFATRDNFEFRQLLVFFALYTGNPNSKWMLKNKFDPQVETLPGLLVESLPKDQTLPPPPLFAAYTRATRVNWRSSWAEDASGVWMRGGHQTDQHDHMDRGHVSFIIKGKPIFIETGTPAYHHPRIRSFFQHTQGHNVLQPVGDNAVEKKPAPITVHRLDAAGGDVTIDPTAGYAGIQQWSRRVEWTAEEMTITDTVLLLPDTQEIVTFHWHLGTSTPVLISETDHEQTVSWEDATLAATANTELLITQNMEPDNSRSAREWDCPDPDPMHACLKVQTTEKVNTLTMVTRIRSADLK